MPGSPLKPSCSVLHEYDAVACCSSVLQYVLQLCVAVCKTLIPGSPLEPLRNVLHKCDAVVRYSSVLQRCVAVMCCSMQDLNSRFALAAYSQCIT